MRLGRDESYRLSQDDAGNWVARDRLGNPIGDTIALVRDVCGSMPFAEVVYQLRSTADLGTLAVEPLPRLPPRIPPSTHGDVEAGRRHLDRLGIAPSVIDFAERSGFIRFVAGALVFCGADEHGRVRNATRYALNEADPAPNRDLAGTDQRYARVLGGDGDCRTVFLVENGVDALALHTLYGMAASPLPHVVVTGGSDILGWGDDLRVQALLSHADRVIMVSGRASSPADQSTSGLRRQVALVRDLSGCVPGIWSPRHGNGVLDELAALRLERIDASAASEPSPMLRLDRGG